MSADDVHPDVFDSDGDLAAFAADLRAAAAATPEPVIRQELAQLFEQGLPPVPPPTTARARRPQLVRRIVIAAGALVVGTGGLGVAGALPAPVQRTVADVAEIVGVQLPSPDERPAEVPAPTTPPGLDTVVPETPPGTVPATPPSTVPARPETPTKPAQPADRSRGEEKREVAEERQAPKGGDDERPATADARSGEAPRGREEPAGTAEERSPERPEAGDPPASAQSPERAEAPAPPAREAQPLPPSPRRPDPSDPADPDA